MVVRFRFDFALDLNETSMASAGSAAVANLPLGIFATAVSMNVPDGSMNTSDDELLL